MIEQITKFKVGKREFNTPENRAELEQTLREHGRGLGIEVGS